MTDVADAKTATWSFGIEAYNKLGNCVFYFKMIDLAGLYTVQYASSLHIVNGKWFVCFSSYSSAEGVSAH